MRILVMALAISLAAVAARAQQDTDWDMGNQVRFTEKPSEPAAPRTALGQAEAAVKMQLTGPAGLAFRDVTSQVVTSVRQGPFAERIPGPVSIVCGRYAEKDAAGGKPSYAWFFVPVKHNKVLWTTVDQPSDAQGDAYLSCKNAGLAN